LNLSNRQATRIQRDDLVVEAGKAPLVFEDQLRLERARPVARNVDRHRAVIVSTVLPVVPLR
jgi:hypothetical protein